VSERLPRLTASEVIGLLEKRGYVRVRSSGSHMIYKDSSGRRTTVPFHGNKVLHPRVLKSILKDIELSAEDLKKELGR
jgi:predicted RNA binding protein YcfA (HicA-like mRNA interferase family)